MVSNVQDEEKRKEGLRRRRKCNIDSEEQILLYDMHICIDWLDAKSGLEIDIITDDAGVMSMTEREEN